MLRRDSFEVSSDSSQLQLPVTETFSDYRSVGGVMISFRTVQNTLSQGDIVVKVKDVKFDVDIPDTMFQSKAKK
jgi:hypothetical protein